MEIRRHRYGAVPGPGLYLMPAALYHADPVAELSLSSSIAKCLVEETPRHAWARHPQLNPDFEEDSEARRELGSLVHKMVTGRGRGVAALDFPDFRTKAAQVAREEAIDDGKIVVTRAAYEKAAEIRDTLRRRIRQVEGANGAFRRGLGEPVIVWRDEAGAWCRTMMDWWGPSEGELWDLKTTSAGLSDHSLANRFAEGLDVQCAFHERAVLAIRPDLAGRLKHRFVFAETKAPFEVRIVEAPEAALEIGRKKVAYAIELWRRCRQSGLWPGYENRIVRVDYPGWAETRWLDREMQDEILRDGGLDPFLARAPWRPKPRQAPKQQLSELVP